MRRIAALAAALVLLPGCTAGPEPTADAPEPTADTQDTQETQATPDTVRTRDPSAPSGSASPSDAPSDSPTSTAPAPRGTRVVLGPSPFGDMLFDARRQAIYLFDVETTDRPRCYDACERAWPPVRTTAKPLAGPGLRDALLGTTRRRDGTTQVTYGGHPLYFYAHEGPGEVKCHDVFLNGGTWYAVGAAGDRLP